MISSNSILLTLRATTIVGLKRVVVFKSSRNNLVNQNTCVTLVSFDDNVFFGEAFLLTCFIRDFDIQPSQDPG